MALLPVAASPGVSHAGAMSDTHLRAHGAAPSIRRLARRAASVVAECNYAQRRLFHLRLSLDSYVYDPRQVPGTYAEFLYRSAGTLRHEPSAQERAAGWPYR
jgi:hypothetical protein